MTYIHEKMLRALYGEEFETKRDEFETFFQGIRDSCVEEAHKAALAAGYEGATFDAYVDDFRNGFAWGQIMLAEAFLCLARDEKTEEELLSAGWDQECVDQAKELVACMRRMKEDVESD